MSKKIYIIDGYNFLYRVFYAIPPFSLKDGTPVNAVFGMAKILMGLHTEDKPDYLIFTLDAGSKSRTELYPEYKGTRDRMPDNLRIQEGIVMNMLAIMGIQPLKIDGYEADDIIGTLVTNLKKNPENDIFILSGDKDLYQFIEPNVCIYDTMKKRVFHTEDAREKFGVDPEYIVDYLAICGDTSDNIPGIPSFGPKKAESLINTYGNLESIYEHLAEMTEKTREVLEANRDVAFLSKKLATIDTEVTLENFHLQAHTFREKTFITPEVIDFFVRYDFRSLVPKEHIATKDISSLPITKIRIENEEILLECIEKLKTIKKVSIATYGDRFSLAGGSIYFGEKEIYTFETRTQEIHAFFKEMFSQEYNIIGYDIKKDLERIEAYMEGDISVTQSGQMGLF